MSHRDGGMTMTMTMTVLRCETDYRKNRRDGDMRTTVLRCDTRCLELDLAIQKPQPWLQLEAMRTDRSVRFLHYSDAELDPGRNHYPGHRG